MKELPQLSSEAAGTDDWESSSGGPPVVPKLPLWKTQPAPAPSSNRLSRSRREKDGSAVWDNGDEAASGDLSPELCSVGGITLRELQRAHKQLPPTATRVWRRSGNGHGWRRSGASSSGRHGFTRSGYDGSGRSTVSTRCSTFRHDPSPEETERRSPKIPSATLHSESDNAAGPAASTAAAVAAAVAVDVESAPGGASRVGPGPLTRELLSGPEPRSTLGRANVRSDHSWEGHSWRVPTAGERSLIELTAAAGRPGAEISRADAPDGCGAQETAAIDISDDAQACGEACSVEPDPERAPATMRAWVQALVEGAVSAVALLWPSTPRATTVASLVTAWRRTIVRLTTPRLRDAERHNTTGLNESAEAALLPQLNRATAVSTSVPCGCHNHAVLTTPPRTASDLLRAVTESLVQRWLGRTNWDTNVPFEGLNSRLNVVTPMEFCSTCYRSTAHPIRGDYGGSSIVRVMALMGGLAMVFFSILHMFDLSTLLKQPPNYLLESFQLVFGLAIVALESRGFFFIYCVRSCLAYWCYFFTVPFGKAIFYVFTGCLGMSMWNTSGADTILGVLMFSIGILNLLLWFTGASVPVCAPRRHRYSCGRHCDVCATY